ncbi:AraC family transcriptional regulator [Leucobacter sp. USHLN153]|uniref:AraC family transcriptional regulator n=1 Tax=Leucobacter sp. USHLN153 TaxID=3081268 RepID=UPI0030179315
MLEDQRGVLYPSRLPRFDRVPPKPRVAHAVRWFWIPEWNLPTGVESRQEVLPFPACNLVIDADGIELVGPQTRRSERVLTGSGWAVGALLLPAATLALAEKPSLLRDATHPVADPALHAEVVAAMADPARPADERRADAVARFADWVTTRVPPTQLGDEAELANRLGVLLDDPEITRVDQLPERLHASVRTLQRTADRAFGLSLSGMIRRRRLQEAAARLREQPEVSIAQLASELGYSDHAHFSTDFKAVLGVTPSDYRLHASR